MLPMTLPLQFGDALADCKHGQCDGFRPQIMKPSGVRIIQLSA